jgi:precorrin-6B methylase 2
VKTLSFLKELVVDPDRKPRTILSGPFKGIKMNLTLRHQAQIYLGLFERETHPWLRQLSKDVKTAVDIGTAHGEHTLFFLMKTNATTVYAFEPDAACLPLIDKNLKLNGMAQSERLKLSTKFVGDCESADQIRLDSLAGAISEPCLIKMDVDGAEGRILQNAAALNRLPGIRWLIETHSKELEDTCVKILSGAGLQTRIIRNAPWRAIVPERRPVLHNRWLAAWKSD